MSGESEKKLREIFEEAKVMINIYMYILLLIIILFHIKRNENK